MPLSEQQIIGHLREALHVEGDLDGETRLFSTGELDSVAMMNLIAFVEETARIEVRPQDVTLDNFDTPARIVRFAEGQA